MSQNIAGIFKRKLCGSAGRIHTLLGHQQSSSLKVRDLVGDIPQIDNSGVTKISLWPIGRREDVNILLHSPLLLGGLDCGITFTLTLVTSLARLILRQYMTRSMASNFK